MIAVDITVPPLVRADDVRTRVACQRAVRRLQRAQLAEARRIRQAVVDTYGLTPALFLSPCRQRTVAEARQVAMYLIRQDLCWPQGTGPHARNAPFPAQRIGRLLGRDQATVLHGVAAIAARLAGDPALRHTVRSIRATLDATYETTDPLSSMTMAPTRDGRGQGDDRWMTH